MCLYVLNAEMMLKFNMYKKTKKQITKIGYPMHIDVKKRFSDRRIEQKLEGKEKQKKQQSTISDWIDWENSSKFDPLFGFR